MILSKFEIAKLHVKTIRRRECSDIDCYRILNDYNAGASVNRLAHEHGATDYQIKKILDLNNVPVRNQKLASRLSMARPSERVTIMKGEHHEH
ncbi:hypothetical protein [Zhongshania aliphaticivorans]|uniref:hypothetical protein n=1 Tax=Zhongshania aliphaticivorans TaxID=1470434 RepID=UPI0012E4F9B0|nr:hypothetical protein [Zhongshania aliphaticivorans]CAA0103303.1 Uncharacterised protein [Zhongshania aliphaticivorans]